MKNLKLFSCLVLLFPILLMAQQTPTAIYRISPEEAKTLLENPYKIPLETIENQLLHTLVDTFSTESYKNVDELKGFFLFVNAVGEQLEARLKTYFNHSIRDYSDGKQLIIHVIDSTGAQVRNAQVDINGKKIPFDEKTQSYRTNKANDGIISAKIGDETILYNFYRKNKWSLFWEKTGNRWNYFSKRLKRYPKNNERETYYDYYKPLKYKRSNGYLVISQPKFNILDTVKVKAYITKKKGKPINQSIEYIVYDKKIDWNDEFKSNGITSGILKPNTKGNYTFDFVLGDSLKLDQAYHIYFTEKRNKRKPKAYFHESFYLEDYELDKIDFSLQTDGAYEIGEKIIITASAKDKNGNFIPDGYIKLVAVPSYITDFKGDELAVKDTLWQHEQPLRNNDFTKIIIPWDSMPDANMSVLVRAVISNGSGDYQDLSTNFSINREREKIIIKYDSNNIIKARFLRDGIEQPQKAIFKISGSSLSNILLEKEVDLPFEMKYVSADEHRFVFHTENTSAWAATNFISSYISWNGIYNSDSIQIQLNNPRKLLIEYKIFERNTLVTSGITKDNQFVFQAKNKSNRTYTVDYQYVWSGSRNFKKKTFEHDSKKLNIAINQPETILPGQRLNIKLNVTGHKGLPAPNTNLTAFAINSAFENSSQYQLPTRIQPLGKRKLIDVNYSTSKFILNRNFDYDQNWYKRLSLEQSLYYRIRFPEKSILMEYNDVAEVDTFYKNIAQFSPYIVENGKRKAIHLIYLDEKIIYHSGANKSQPYAFKADEGYHKITIRTHNRLYYVDSVYLKNGHKLELSIDEIQFFKHPHAKHIFYIAVDNQFSELELSQIRSNTLLLTPMFHFEGETWFFKQGDNNIHKIEKKDDYYTMAIFPFPSDQFAEMIIPNKLQKDFRVLSNYEYAIYYDKLKLIKNQDYLTENRTLNKYPSRYKKQDTKEGQLVLTPSDLVQPISLWKKMKYFQRRKHYVGVPTNTSPNPRKAKLTLNYNKNKKELTSSNTYVVWFKNGVLQDISLLGS